MSPARALALAALDHGNAVRRHALDDDPGREVGTAWEALLTSARLFADEHDLDEPQMYAVMDAVVNATTVTFTDTITTERNR